MAKKKGGLTVTKVWELCEPIVKDFGLSLWDVRYVKEGADWFLRVYIDKPDGIDITDCENVSRAIDKPLDELDPIESAYCLEVCSPPGPGDEPGDGLRRFRQRPCHDPGRRVRHCDGQRHTGCSGRRPLCNGRQQP